MGRERKFIPGRFLRTMEAVSRALDAGRWICLRGVPKHPGVMQSMTWRTLRLFAQRGSLRLAQKWPSRRTAS